MNAKLNKSKPKFGVWVWLALWF